MQGHGSCEGSQGLSGTEGIEVKTLPVSALDLPLPCPSAGTQGSAGKATDNAGFVCLPSPRRGEMPKPNISPQDALIAIQLPGVRTRCQ